MSALLAFHSDKAIKTKYLSRVKAHAKAYEIIKGRYWSEGKGCAVGCTIHSDQHSAYETELGIPVMLARLEDAIFEGSSNEYAKTWPERFLKAIKPGVDLSKVGWKFQHWLLLDPKYGSVRYAREQDKEIFKQVGSLLWDLALGKQISESARSAAESVARSAAESVVWSARSAAESVAWSARSAAESVAWSARSAAESVAYERQGEYLLKLLKEAK